MTVKALVFDLDRTLLHTDKSVSERTLSALAECRKRGILIFAATARSTRNVTEYNEMIGFDAFSSLNGAVVLLPGSVSEYDISRESAYAIVSALVSDPDNVISLETSDGFLPTPTFPCGIPLCITDFRSCPRMGRCIRYS